MDAARINVKSTHLQTFLQLSCRRWQRGEVVIDKSSLVDLLQRFHVLNKDRNAIGKKTRKVLQESFFTGNSLRHGSSICTNTRYNVDIVPELMKYFDLRIAQLSWARIKKDLEELANTGSLALDDSLKPLQALQDLQSADSDAVPNFQNQFAAIEAEPAAPEMPSAKSKAAESNSAKRRRTMPLLGQDVSQEIAEQLMPPEPERVVPLPSSSSSSRPLVPQGDSPVDAILQEYRRQYQGSTTDDLLREIALREEKLQKQIRENTAQGQAIQDLKQKLRGEKQRIRRLTQSNQKLHAKVKTLGGKCGKQQEYQVPWTQ
jgi:hypothetical protein